ncbi:M15 family peptidase [Brucella abortus]|uniref:M15 family metallopeptidase n=1 Tax=Brucella abortus TaxID=235 RepID=UPI0004E91A3F|nr:M15 family metallopeptidase [Brucella abortus]KFH18442.1 endolysin [Brucella abortus LMN1]RUQ67325.1 M15 family peptidase [Brucella abortus]RUQ78541.1 M15 family peptidase [Brucella abortus]RUQ88286.1 M15 family peptidase [Brucella abortus]RUQ90315.1 M15 family peptidase [Brucella abortus]
MTYVLGRTSRSRLEGVHPDIVRVTERAIQLTEQDFTVFDGLRTVAQQREMVRRGASQTMNSKHLPQGDGFGHAVDLVPWINGQPRWEWGAIWPICRAVRTAAEELGVRIRWGGHWGELNGTTVDPEELVRRYVDAKLRAGQRAFNDGPHYELLR